MHAEYRQRRYGESAEKVERLRIECGKSGRWRGWLRLTIAALAAALRCLEERREWSERDHEGSRSVLFPPGDDVAAAQRWKECEDRLAHDRDAVLAVVAASRDDEELARALSLSGADPAFRAVARFLGGGE